MSSSRRVPAVLTAFTVFSVLVTLGSLALLRAPTLAERIVPFTGWVPGMSYMFALVFALQLRWRPNAVSHLGILGILVLGAVFGVIGFIQRPSMDYGNPWLTVSPWRPLWTVALPLAWCALLLSPGVIRFCRPASAPDAQPVAGQGPHAPGA